MSQSVVGFSPLRERSSMKREGYWTWIWYLWHAFFLWKIVADRTDADEWMGTGVRFFTGDLIALEHLLDITVIWECLKQTTKQFYEKELNEKPRWAVLNGGMQISKSEYPLITPYAVWKLRRPKIERLSFGTALSPQHFQSRVEWIGSWRTFLVEKYPFKNTVFRWEHRLGEAASEGNKKRKRRKLSTMSSQSALG